MFETAALPNLLPALPELILAGASLMLVLIGAIMGEKSLRLITVLSIAVLIAALGIVMFYSPERAVTFNGSFIVDGFSRFMKVLTLLGSIAALLLSYTFMNQEKFARFEYPLLVVLATLGMMLMISANDLIALYLGLELQSLALYVVAAINRDNLKSTEAGLKYFVLGALSSGMLLYGASFIYGFTGSVQFETIAKSIAGPQSTIVVFGLVFVIAGLAFKISAVPFHMWTPDVYEGAPTPVTAFFAGAPKMAAMALMVRVLIGAFPNVMHDWQQIVSFIAIASMLLGGFAAIGQSNLKRLMAYSSIANMGYALVALASGTIAGVEGVLVFMATYLAMTLGIFACVLALKHATGRAETIEDLSGLARSNPGVAVLIGAMMFSLIGVPPLGGFFAKYYAFSAAVQVNLWPLAVIGMLASVVSAFYYLRIVKVMYFDEPRFTYGVIPLEIKFVMVATCGFVILLMLYLAPVINAAKVAAKSLF
jgi:NADH-quinone oxidoreductase subunit N